LVHFDEKIILNERNPIECVHFYVRKSAEKARKIFEVPNGLTKGYDVSIKDLKSSDYSHVIHLKKNAEFNIDLKNTNLP
jgi:hypothetical protein